MFFNFAVALIRKPVFRIDGDYDQSYDVKNKEHVVLIFERVYRIGSCHHHDARL